MVCTALKAEKKKKKKAESKFREKGVGIPKLSILELESTHQ